MKSLNDLLPNLDDGFEVGLSNSEMSINSNRRQNEDTAKKLEVSQATKIATAFEDGRREAVRELQALHEAQLDQLRTAEQLKFEAIVKDLEVEKAKEFSALLKTNLCELEQKLDALLFALVAPFIKKLVPILAMKELEVLANGALTENVTYKLEVNGPQDLIEGLKESLSSLKIEVVTEVTNRFEVQVRCDEFLLTTRIQEWLNKIEDKIDS